MEVDDNGMFYMYYGIFNINDKPTHGVHFFMFDEYIKNSVEKEKEKFRKELSITMGDFKKSTKKVVGKNEIAIKVVGASLSDLNKHLSKIIKENKLKLPPEKKKGK